jgi:putative DNA primase/helicase
MAVAEELSRVVAALERVRGPDSNGWYTALCPFHNDQQRPNLRFNERGYRCMACDAKGSLRNLVQGLGLAEGGGDNDSPIAATYDYRDEQGKLLFQVVRKSPKAFSQRRPAGAGGWTWNLNGTRRVLYRLPELLAADPNVPVFLVEGEKDVDRLAALGLIATTNPGGAGKWRDEYSSALRGRRVVVLRDNDEAGSQHREQVARSLHGVAVEVRMLELPGLPEKGDVSDWLDAGGTAEELLTLAASAPLWEPESTGAPLLDFATTDAGNGELFAQLYGDRVRYDHRRKRWLLWGGHWWADDRDGEVRRLAKVATRHRYMSAPSCDDLERRTVVAKFAIASEHRQRLDAMLLQAQAEFPVADSGARWDRDPWLLGVANGVVDLRTGRLRPGQQEDRITLHSDVPFIVDARCQRWLRFLDEVFRGDKDLIDFIWRAVGYSLTGDTTEQCLFLGHGVGANGKGVFLSTVRAIAGDYAYNAPFSIFELERRASIPNDLAALASRRVVTSSETNEGTRLNEARIKALTGCDPCTARFLHGEFFTFDPVAKYWLAVNHRPLVTDDSHGFWRRVRLIPFLRVFREGEAEPRLEEALREELPGILAWAVRGAVAWRERGLAPPAAVRSATETYRVESDPLAQFLGDCCIEGEGCQGKATEFYKAYCRWAGEQGMNDREKLTSTTFGNRMTARFEKKRTNRGNAYVGVGLLDETHGSSPHETAGQENHLSEVQGSVQGLESTPRENEVSSLEELVTRENLTEACTTLHTLHEEPPPVDGRELCVGGCGTVVPAGWKCSPCADAAVRAWKENGP